VCKCEYECERGGREGEGGGVELRRLPCVQVCGWECVGLKGSARGDSCVWVGGCVGRCVGRSDVCV